MAQMSPDHGAGNFRSESPPARISDNDEHDIGMLNTTGHTASNTGHATFGGGPGIGPSLYRVMPDMDTDRGF